MRSIAILLSLPLFLGAAWAQEMKMHRKQAGEPDQSGWMLAASTEGRFSVRLPLKFNDFTVAEKNPDAPAARTHTVGARSAEKITLQATRIEYRKGAAAAREYFSRFEKGQAQATTTESVTPRKVGAQRAVDLVLRKGADVAWQRVVLLDKDLLMLTVDSPKEHEAVSRQLAEKFFDSLQVDPK
jgi:hypothetical protein